MTTSTNPSPDPATAPVTSAVLARQAADALRERTGVTEHDVAIVMGSGWSAAANQLGPVAHDIAVTDLPGFFAPSVSGHTGRIRSMKIADHHVLVLLGRTHLYEQRGIEPVVHGVRTAAAAGARTIILTNASGVLRRSIPLGVPVLISDHLNLTGHTPLVGSTFLPLGNAYSPALRRVAHSVNPDLTDGVYAALTGPQYETHAEVAMLRSLGADLVGMSTVLETIAAREVNCEVLGIALGTNYAAGVAEDFTHDDVLLMGQRSAQSLGRFLREVITALPSGDTPPAT